MTESAAAGADCTQGHLLDGRVRYAQPRHGYRSGIEPVLLAATLPARASERVLEGGSGAGATLLCLAARVPGVLGLGIEQDPALVALARQNAAANDWPGLDFLAGDVTVAAVSQPIDHACANPPYHPESATPSPQPHRRAARQATPGLLHAWAAALARPLRAGGTLTCILPASRLPEATAAFAAAGCRPTAMLPLWPKAGQPAKLLLLRGVKASRAPFRVLPGLVLHTPEGRFTAAAEAVLREAMALPM